MPFRLRGHVNATVVRACVWLVLLISGAAHAAGGDRFVGQFPVGHGFTGVVAEGDMEPRSIGTYSVRLYTDLEVGAYVTGISQRRGGFVRKAFPAGVDGDGRALIVVEVETAGSGRYVTRDVFVFDGSTVTLRP